MIILHQPPRCWGLPSMSPFCVKLETYLRMAEIPYKPTSRAVMNGPKGRMPYIEIDGQRLGDSTLIIQELKRRYGDKLDTDLSPEQRALGLATQRLLEDHLYFAGAWLRWNTDESWAYVREVLKPMMPPVIGALVLKYVRTDFVNYIASQGIGEHTREEVIAFAKEDLSAVSVLLAEKPFLLGEKPSSYDAMLYGFLIQQLWVPWDSTMKKYAQSLPNLEAYCERMRKRYWSDFSPSR